MRARLYVTAVIASGLGLLVSVAALHGSALIHDGPAGMWVLFAAVIVGELVPIKLGTGEGEVAPSTTFTFALLLSSGLAAAAIAVAAASGLSDLIDRKRPSRSAFNIAQYVLAIAAAGAVLVARGRPARTTMSSRQPTCRPSSPPPPSSSSSTPASSPGPSR